MAKNTTKSGTALGSNVVPIPAANRTVTKSDNLPPDDAFPSVVEGWDVKHCIDEFKAGLANHADATTSAGSAIQRCVAGTLGLYAVWHAEKRTIHSLAACLPTKEGTPKEAMAMRKEIRKQFFTEITGDAMKLLKNNAEAWSKYKGELNAINNMIATALTVSAIFHSAGVTLNDYIATDSVHAFNVPTPLLVPHEHNGYGVLAKDKAKVLLDNRSYSVGKAGGVPKVVRASVSQIVAAFVSKLGRVSSGGGNDGLRQLGKDITATLAKEMAENNASCSLGLVAIITRLEKDIASIKRATLTDDAWNALSRFRPVYAKLMTIAETRIPAGASKVADGKAAMARDAG